MQRQRMTLRGAQTLLTIGDGRGPSPYRGHDWNAGRVTPWDDLQYWPSPESEWEFVDDGTPFVFRIEGWLEDWHISYGLYGPVVDGLQRYRDLICSIIVREDSSDWRVESCSSAAFKVGPSIDARITRMIFGIPRLHYLKVIPECQDLAKL